MKIDAEQRVNDLIGSDFLRWLISDKPLKGSKGRGYVITDFYPPTDKCELTTPGEVELENFVISTKKARNKEIRSWIRYGITTAIALAALIKSFFFN